MMPYNRKLKTQSRMLRNNMTDAERKLWAELRGKKIKGYSFYRQKPMGNYIVDFYCPKAKLVIEVDGGQHFLEKGKESDRVRDEYLRNLRLRILRFSNHDILTNLDGVIEYLYNWLPEANDGDKGFE